MTEDTAYRPVSAKGTLRAWLAEHILRCGGITTERQLGAAACDKTPTPYEHGVTASLASCAA